MSGKRVSLASLAAGKVEAVPGASRPDLIHVSPETVAPTPLNPRRSFAEDELTELGEDMRTGQLQPCVAVARAAYVKLYPEHAEKLPDGCRYVMAAGERRWRAAIKVGLDSLDVMLRHDLTESRIRFLAAVLSENVQRANFNPIEEADGLRAMLDLHEGNQAAAARAMGKSKAWFNQRIGLLRLSDQMVELVLAGKLTAFRDMRRYAALPTSEQYQAWKQDQEAPRIERATPAQENPAPQPRPAVQSSSDRAGGQQAAPVRQETAAGEGRKPQTQTATPGPAYTAVYADTAPAPHPEPQPGPQETERTGLDEQPIPEQRPEPIPAGRTLPYDDGVTVARHLILKMPPDAFTAMLRYMNQHAAEHGLEAGATG